MFKRTWIGLALILSIGVLILSACGSGDLAEDLTPIPTLPAGEEPALREAIAPVSASGGELSEDELVALGQQVFSTNCAGCHGAEDGVGPAFTGMAGHAATRVDGMSAEEYLHESIVDPGAFVVEDFNNVMPGNYGSDLSDDQINGLVAYIIAESGDAPAAEPEETEEPDATEEADESDEAATEATDESAGDAANGETLFADSCAGCHMAEDGAGPGLTGMGEVAAERVEDMSAEEYLHESIVDPSAFVVEGFSDIMPKTFGEKYDESEINDLVAYLLTQ